MSYENLSENLFPDCSYFSLGTENPTSLGILFKFISVYVGSRLSLLSCVLYCIYFPFL